MNIISPKISYTVFGMVSADFRGFIAKIWFLLFFQNLASKSRLLLITTTCFAPLSIWRRPAVTSRRREGLGGEVTNPIQTNYDSNVAIRTFDHEPSAPKNKLFQTFSWAILFHYPAFPLCSLRLCGEIAFALCFC
jgi:hypothetical protein